MKTEFFPLIILKKKKKQRETEMKFINDQAISWIRINILRIKYDYNKANLRHVIQNTFW